MFEFVPERAAVEAVAEYARRARSMGEGVTDNVAAIHGTWKNLDESVRISAAADLPEKFGPIAAEGKRRGEALRDSADAMDQFVTDMEDPHADLRRVIQDANAFRASIPGGMVEIDAEDQFNPMVVTSQTIWGSPLGTATVPAAGTRLQIHWYQHVPSIERNSALHTRADAIMEQIREAITRLNDRLAAIAAGFDLDRGKIPESARATLNLLNKAGLDQVQDMNAQKIGEVLAGELRDVAESGGSGPQFETNVREMLRLLDQYGDDQHVMSSALYSAGAVAMAAVLDHLGHKARDSTNGEGRRAREHAGVLRASLAHASRTWPRDQIEEFAGDLAHIAPTLPAAVGYLFADHDRHPMGEEFTVVVANSLDTYERDPSSPSVLYGGNDGDGARDLTGGETTRRLDDPMARVLQTLGEYPNAALNWLTNDTHGEDRIDHYYQVRNSGYREPGTGDGFEGLGALWAGAQHADGSILDGSDKNLDVQKKVASLSTDIFDRLATNGAFFAEEISPGGSEQIARAVGLQIPQIAVNGINGEADGIPEDPPQTALFEIDNADHRNRPSFVVNATQEEVAAVIGPALTRPEGLETINQASERYGQQVMESIHEHSDLITESEAGRQIERALRVDAAFEGARVGELLSAAARDEAVVRARITLPTGYVSGKIAMPAGHAGIEAKGMATGGITELMVDAFSGAAEDIADHEAQRTAELDRLMGEKTDQLVTALDAQYNIGPTSSEIAFQKGEADTKYMAWKDMLAP